MEITGWPKLTIAYRTDPAKVAELLPPGIEPGPTPEVQVGVYCIPVRDEPEYGISTKVSAVYDGIEGWYSLGMGIDQESAIFISQETNGQPKFPCRVHYFRMGDTVEARASHQGYTFMTFKGTTSNIEEGNGEDAEHNEWWIKSLRSVNNVENEFDFPPHVIRVQQISEVKSTEYLDGEMRLHESPWDPHTRYLPMEEQLWSKLTVSQHKARNISKMGALDPVAFWPHADVIGGSRWPGKNGGPVPVE